MRRVARWPSPSAACLRRRRSAVAAAQPCTICSVNGAICSPLRETPSSSPQPRVAVAALFARVLTGAPRRRTGRCPRGVIGRPAQRLRRNERVQWRVLAGLGIIDGRKRARRPAELADPAGVATPADLALARSLEGLKRPWALREAAWWARVLMSEHALGGRVSANWAHMLAEVLACQTLLDRGGGEEAKGAFRASSSTAMCSTTSLVRWGCLSRSNLSSEKACNGSGRAMAQRVAMARAPRLEIISGSPAGGISDLGRPIAVASSTHGLATRTGAA